MISSCGVPKSSTTLKVTNSMALGNTSYQGGLVFYGRSAGGKFFSVPVAYNAGSNSNTAEVILDKGTWTFSAVGWSTGPYTFEGDSECAVTTVNLDENEKTVVLDLDKNNCSNSEFGGNFVSTQFKPYGLITCGTLYNSSSPLTILSTDSPNYCSSSTTISPDLKNWAKSAKIMIPAIAPGQAPGLDSPLSFCEDLVQGKANNPGYKRLPAKGVPLIVELFESSCADTEKKLIQRYELRQGLNFPYPNFDHKVFSTGASSNLYLLSSISRRGISSLMNSLPSFRCGSTPCSAIPESSTDRVIASGHRFYLDQTNSLVKCQYLTNIAGASNTLAITSGWHGCEERNGKIFIRLEANDLSTIGCTSNCTPNFVFDDGTSLSTVSLGLKVVANVTPLAAYDLIFGTIGHEDIISTQPTGNVSNAINSLSAFTDDQNDGEYRHFGILSQIRELFNPEGVGGIFSQYQTSSAMVGVGTNISLWDEGIQKSFNISVESDSSAPETYLKQDNNPYASTPDHPTFTHKMTVSRILGGAYYPEIKLSWVYGKKVGTAEFKEMKVGDGKQTTERTLIYWNTESTDHARFETYTYEKEVTAGNPSDVLRLKSNFIRAEREPTLGEGNARIERFGYESTKDPSTSDYTQKAQKSGVVLKNTKAIYFSSSLDAVKDFSSNDLDFFERPELKPFTASQSITPKTSSALSPNGNHFVSSWAEYNGSYWVVKILRRSGTSVRTLESYTLGVSSNQPHPKVSINNNGHATVAFVTGQASSFSLFALSWNGSDWRYSNGTTTYSATVSTGVISDLFALDTSTFSISFDLIDEDPGSTSSQKRLIYSVKPNTDWELKYSSFSSDSWSSPSKFSGSEAISQPTLLSMIKVNTSSYHVTWIYNSSGYKLQSLTTDFISTNPSGVTSAYNMPAGETPNTLIPSYNSATLTDLYIANNSGSITNTQYNSSTPGLTTPQTLTGINNNELLIPYCFTRSSDIANRESLGATAQTSDCNLPESSYAPAIRNTVLVDDDNDVNTAAVDYGFKQNIQSLNPATFKFLFTLP